MFQILQKNCIFRYKFQNIANTIAFGYALKKCFIDIQRKIQMFGAGPCGRVQKFQVRVFGFSRIEKGTSNWKPWNRNPLWHLWQNTLANLSVLKLAALQLQKKRRRPKNLWPRVTLGRHMYNNKFSFLKIPLDQKKKAWFETGDYLFRKTSTSVIYILNLSTSCSFRRCGKKWKRTPF